MYVKTDTSRQNITSNCISCQSHLLKAPVLMDVLSTSPNKEV